MAKVALPLVPFPQAARAPLANAQLRKNIGKATRAIRAKRIGLTDELPDWEALRSAGVRWIDAAERTEPRRPLAERIAEVFLEGDDR